MPSFDLRPFGRALTHSLNNARVQPDDTAIWEEEDYCSRPLAQERAAVLDTYSENITVEHVSAGDGWKRIEKLPKRVRTADNCSRAPHGRIKVKS